MAWLTVSDRYMTPANGEKSVTGRQFCVAGKPIPLKRRLSLDSTFSMRRAKLPRPSSGSGCSCLTMTAVLRRQGWTGPRLQGRSMREKPQFIGSTSQNLVPITCFTGQSHLNRAWYSRRDPPGSWRFKCKATGNKRLKSVTNTSQTLLCPVLSTQRRIPLLGLGRISQAS